MIDQLKDPHIDESQSLQGSSEDLQNAGFKENALIKGLSRIQMAGEIPLANNSTPGRSNPCLLEDQETLMIVDDMPENLLAIGELFRANGYRVKVASTGDAALRLARQPPIPSLILLDIMMPTMDGFEVVRELRDVRETRDIPIVFLTAKDEIGIEEAAFANGVVDLIKKPIRPSIILARVRNHLLADKAKRWWHDKNQLLESEVQARKIENQIVQDVCIRALAHLAETRDDETGSHVRRTQDYVRLLARFLARTPLFSETLTDEYVEELVRSVPLHDIGKVGIPDQILPGQSHECHCRRQ